MERQLFFRDVFPPGDDPALPAARWISVLFFFKQSGSLGAPSCFLPLRHVVASFIPYDAATQSDPLVFFLDFIFLRHSSLCASPIGVLFRPSSSSAAMPVTSF